uniref:Uncharacterized protein n=1 Tax=Siphoviridae sp. cteEJ17 TaxID=2827904 RepID=A0A8S5T0M0_9CAUD|nr:MAG TPA: hypothetical protein [Siphoviridae sp. cteEJ17]DAV05851.1 MAG TPA: hypothetical protein [Caudoviricetes sp.]
MHYGVLKNLQISIIPTSKRLKTLQVKEVIRKNEVAWYKRVKNEKGEK